MARPRCAPRSALEQPDSRPRSLWWAGGPLELASSPANKRVKAGATGPPLPPTVGAWPAARANAGPRLLNDHRDRSAQPLPPWVLISPERLAGATRMTMVATVRASEAGRLMDRLILSGAGQNVLKPGLRPSFPHRWHLARRRGQMPGPGSHKSSCAPSSAASPGGVTLPKRIGGSRWREQRKQERG